MGKPPRYRKIDLHVLLRGLLACPEAVDWVHYSAFGRDYETAWRECPNVSWLAWAALGLEVPAGDLERFNRLAWNHLPGRLERHVRQGLGVGPTQTPTKKAFRSYEGFMILAAAGFSCEITPDEFRACFPGRYRLNKRAREVLACSLRGEKPWLLDIDA
jgi:hypothetical protein